MKKTLSILLALCICLLPLYTGCANESPVSVDLDLSVMSSTIVYAQMYNIQYDPGQYLGKVIRMRGLYSFFREPSTGVVYYACVVPDATACCMQGMEFVPAVEPEDPDHFLEDSADITVTGRLEIYVDEGISYLHLVEASVEQNPEN